MTRQELLIFIASLDQQGRRVVRQEYSGCVTKKKSPSTVPARQVTYICNREVEMEHRIKQEKKSQKKKYDKRRKKKKWNNEFTHLFPRDSQAEQREVLAKLGVT